MKKAISALRFFSRCLRTPSQRIAESTSQQVDESSSCRVDFGVTRRLADLPTCRLSPARSGSALIIVLGMLSVLLLMGVAFSVTMRTERSGASNMRHTAMARHILDSALARAMGDLDRALEDDGDLPAPTNLVVAVSYSRDEATGVTPLSYEASLHLPGDQRIAALFEKAQWLPIYGDVLKVVPASWR